MAGKLDLTVANNLGIDQGETYRLFISYALPPSEDEPQVPIDITGCSARMQVREKYGSPVLVELTTEEGGGIVLVGEEGKINITISDVQTDAMGARAGSTRPRTEAVYDLELVFPSGDVQRVVQGVIEIDPNITREVAP